MKARLAYLTTPARGVYVINLQAEGSEETIAVEISRRHLANIIADGASLALRDFDDRAPRAAK